MAVPQSMSVEMTGKYHGRRATLLAPRCSAHSAAYEIASAASNVGCESCGASKGAVHRVAAGLWKSVICQNQYKASDAQIDGFSARLRRNRATSLRADCASCFLLVGVFPCVFMGIFYISADERHPPQRARFGFS